MKNKPKKYTNDDSGLGLNEDHGKHLSSSKDEAVGDVVATAQHVDLPIKPKSKVGTNHNRNEKLRKAKLNSLILKMKDMVPDIAPKESKNSILEKACNYMLHLKDINQKLQDGCIDKVRDAEINDLNSKIEVLENKNKRYQMILRSVKFSNFENWSKKAKSITSRLMMGDPSVLNLAKNSSTDETDVDILRSAVMETLPLSPTAAQTTPDSTTSSAAETQTTSSLPSSSFAAIAVSETVTSSSSATPILSLPKTSTEGAKIKNILASQKKKPAAKSDCGETQAMSVAMDTAASDALLNSSSAASASAALSVSVGVVSQAVMSSVQTVNSGYCANSYQPVNASGIIQNSAPIISSIIQPQLSGQNLNCIQPPVIQPQNNTIILGQQPGMLFSQSMVGGQYTVINPQSFISNTPQVFPQLNAPLGPFVNQPVLPNVGSIGQNIVQLDNKNQFATAFLLPNGQILPVVTQPSIIPASTAPEVVGQINTVITSDVSPQLVTSQPQVILKSSTNVINPTIIRETTSTVAANTAPILVSSQQTPVTPSKVKRPQRIIKPKPIGAETLPPNSTTDSSQSEPCERIDKSDANDILAKAAESIFDMTADDIGLNTFSTVTNANQKNDESAKNVDNGLKAVDDKLLGAACEKRKSDSSTPPQKRMKSSDNAEIAEVISKCQTIPTSSSAARTTKSPAVAETSVKNSESTSPVSVNASAKSTASSALPRKLADVIKNNVSNNSSAAKETVLKASNNAVSVNSKEGYNKTSMAQPDKVAVAEKEVTAPPSVKDTQVKSMSKHSGDALLKSGNDWHAVPQNKELVVKETNNRLVSTQSNLPSKKLAAVSAPSQPANTPCTMPSSKLITEIADQSAKETSIKPKALEHRLPEARNSTPNNRKPQDQKPTNSNVALNVRESQVQVTMTTRSTTMAQSPAIWSVPSTKSGAQPPSVAVSKPNISTSPMSQINTFATKISPTPPPSKVSKFAPSCVPTNEGYHNMSTPTSSHTSTIAAPPAQQQFDIIKTTPTTTANSSYTCNNEGSSFPKATCKANTPTMAPLPSPYASSPCSFAGTPTLICSSAAASPSLPQTSPVSNSAPAVSDASSVPPSSSGFVSITQLTNTSCSMSLNELLTSPTMPEMPATVSNVNSDSNSANSPFSSITNIFGSASPDVNSHMPIQSTRGYCDPARSATSFSASDLIGNSSANLMTPGSKDSSTVVAFGSEFNNTIASHDPLTDNVENQFDKHTLYPPYQQERLTQAMTRTNPILSTSQITTPLPAPSVVNSSVPRISHSISSVPNMSQKDHMFNLGNSCSLSAGNSTINSSNIGEMAPFHHGESQRNGSNLNPMMPIPKQRSIATTHPTQSHVNKLHNVNTMHAKTSTMAPHTTHKNPQPTNSNNVSVNFNDLWHPTSNHNTFNSSQVSRHGGVPKQVKHTSQIDQCFPYHGWNQDQQIYPGVNNCNGVNTHPNNGYSAGHSRSPSTSNYRHSPAAHSSPGVHHSSTTAPSSSNQATAIRQSPVADINKGNSLSKSYAATPVQDSRVYSQMHKAAPCFNSNVPAYHRTTNSSLSSTYSAEALIGDSVNNCNQGNTHHSYHASKSNPHSAESLIPLSTPSNISSNVQSTFNFQALNPVVSSSSNTPSHFTPGLNLIPRPRFPGFPVPGSNGNSLPPIAQQNCSTPVDDNFPFGWPPPPRLPAPSSVGNNYPNSSSRTNQPSSQNKTLQAKGRSQKPVQNTSSVNSNQSTVNPFQMSSYDRTNPMHHSTSISGMSTKTKAPNSRNSSSKSKSKSTAKKNKSSANLPSSSLEEINLSGSIFETNRSITPYFGVHNFSPPRTDTPTYLPNNIMNSSNRSQSHETTVPSTICNTFGTPLFPPRCQANLNLNFPQASSSFSVSSIHHPSVPTQAVTTTSSTSHFHLSNIFPDINNSSSPSQSSSISAIKFPHGNHFAHPPSGGGQVGFEPHLQQKQGSGASNMYNSRPHPPPPVLHNGMSINSILGNGPTSSPALHHNHGSSFDSTRQNTSHAQVGSMGPPHPPLVHPQGPTPFSNVLHTLNFPVQDH